ncbi:helix-turn-helix transcriptional regulator [Streptomyces sp. WAC06614]|uniref:helix-turn-helix domain-containing protein n=1 Tax=Streptomyces sp. WAC06614 TaxID=2487416 RepID=UPI0021B06971|nr:helix-turn-helix transcriptional regulator [Streptomyces sp. WAC06614]
MVATARHAKSLTQQELADLVNVDVETIASIEQGRRALKPDIAERLDLQLGLPGVLTAGALRLPDVDITPAWVEGTFEALAEARSLCWYETLLVPGVLQTEAYARAVFTCRIPYYGEDKIESLIARRMERQEILRRPVPPDLSFILSEAGLRDRLGGDDVYREQLHHLRAMADHPAVSFQVLPLGLTEHAGLTGPFIVMETPQHQWLASCESQHGTVLMRDPSQVSLLVQKYGMLRTQALNLPDTKGLLERLLGEL